MSRHNRRLKLEHQKASPNWQVIQELMDKTFVLRRNDIVKEARDVTKILEEYPFLGFEDQVSVYVHHMSMYFKTYVCMYNCNYVNVHVDCERNVPHSED